MLEFCHFNYDMSYSGPLWFPLDWDLLCFLGLCDFLFHQIREVFIITFSKRFSIPCSSSSPSGISIVRILLYFMLSCISLNLSSFFLSLFSFSCSFWVFFSTLYSSSLFWSSASLRLPLIPYIVFFNSEIVFFISSCPFFIISISFFMLIYAINLFY